MPNDKTVAKGEAAASANRDWNHHPDLPVVNTPLFDWPPRPVAAFRWLASYWLALSMTLLEALLAVFVWAFLTPDLSSAQELSMGWIAQVWARNIGIMLVFAGGLHLYLVTFSRQGKKLKFDARDQARNNGTYTFRNQVLDNMFWSLASGVTIWTAYEVMWMHGAANGIAPIAAFLDNPVWFFAFLLLIPIWSSFHFYWIHRFLHWPPLYRLAHSLHHRNVNVGPWSGISMHPVEHLLYFSSVLIHFVVPSDPIHVAFHFLYLTIGPVASHSGFEGLLARDRNRMKLGDFFHQLHHRYFECNYGTIEMPWDRWFGTFHDGTEDATVRTRERKRRMHSQ